MTGDPYPPFSGPDSTCPKCGNRMGIKYMPAGTVFAAPDLVLYAKGPEWLLRECCECDYQWAEMCRDAYPETALP